MRGVRQRIASHLVLLWAAVLWAGFTAGPLVPCASAAMPSSPGADEHAAHRGHEAPAPDAPCHCTGLGCCPPAILASARPRWQPHPVLTRWHDPVVPNQPPPETQGRLLPFPLGPPATPIS